MIRRKSAATLLALTAFVGLTAAKCGEAENDNAPEQVSGVILNIYGPDVPMPSDRKCTYGSFAVQAPDGVIHSVCAATKNQHTKAKTGDKFSRN